MCSSISAADGFSGEFILWTLLRPLSPSSPSSPPSWSTSPSTSLTLKGLMTQAGWLALTVSAPEKGSQTHPPRTPKDKIGRPFVHSSPAHLHQPQQIVSLVLLPSNMLNSEPAVLRPVGRLLSRMCLRVFCGRLFPLHSSTLKN